MCEALLPLPCALCAIRGKLPLQSVHLYTKDRAVNLQPSPGHESHSPLVMSPVMRSCSVDVSLHCEMAQHRARCSQSATRGLRVAAGDRPTLAAAVRKALSSAGHFWRCAYFRVRVRKSSFLPFTHVLLTRSCGDSPVNRCGLMLLNRTLALHHLIKRFQHEIKVPAISQTPVIFC